ncbi:translation initiation factor IF-2, partial [Streptomyces sp. SID4945]|nr:translation initiation factor IF-2 [Streptomyces sp. SID4945]
METWREDVTTGRSHEPQGVTVDLDSLGRRSADLPAQDGTGTRPGPGEDGAEGPVFVDASGRRSRRYRRLGLGLGLACGAYAAVICATLVSGNSDAPWLPLPQPAAKAHADKVKPSPPPSTGVESATDAGAGADAAPPVLPAALVPGLPGRTGLPGLPGTPGIPDIPKLPGAGTAPGTGKTPGKSGTPGAVKPSPGGGGSSPG